MRGVGHPIRDVGHDPDHERAVLWCGGEEEHTKERTDGDFDHRDFLTIGVGPISRFFGDKAEWARQDLSPLDKVCVLPLRAMAERVVDICENGGSELSHLRSARHSIRLCPHRHRYRRRKETAPPALSGQHHSRPSSPIALLPRQGHSRPSQTVGVRSLRHQECV